MYMYSTIMYIHTYMYDYISYNAANLVPGPLSMSLTFELTRSNINMIVHVQYVYIYVQGKSTGIYKAVYNPAGFFVCTCVHVYTCH